MGTLKMTCQTHNQLTGYMKDGADFKLLRTTEVYSTETSSGPMHPRLQHVKNRLQSLRDGFYLEKLPPTECAAVRAPQK